MGGGPQSWGFNLGAPVVPFYPFSFWVPFLIHTGGCQNYGPLLGTLKNRCCIIIGTLILTTTHTEPKDPHPKPPTLGS